MSVQAIYDSLQKAMLLLHDGDTRLLRPFGLNRTQYVALQLLDIESGRRLVDLAEAMLCERSTITRIIDYLEEQGLVQRHNDVDDRRSQRVVLTPEGLELQERSRDAHEKSLQRRLGLLGKQEQAKFQAVLDKLLEGLLSDLAASADEKRS